MLTERERQIVENESPQVLRALVASMAEHIEEQKKLITQLQNEKAAKENAFVVEERVNLLRWRLYGKSSEVFESTDRPRDKGQGEAQLFSQTAFSSPEAKQNQSNGKDLSERIIDHRVSSEGLREESVPRGLGNPSGDQWMKKNQDQPPKRNAFVRLVMWWKIDPVEINTQIIEYDSLSIWKSARKISAIFLVFSGAVTYRRPLGPNRRLLGPNRRLLGPNRRPLGPKERMNTQQQERKGLLFFLFTVILFFS